MMYFPVGDTPDSSSSGESLVGFEQVVARRYLELMGPSTSVEIVGNANLTPPSIALLGIEKFINGFHRNDIKTVVITKAPRATDAPQPIRRLFFVARNLFFHICEKVGKASPGLRHLINQGSSSCVFSARTQYCSKHSCRNSQFVRKFNVLRKTRSLITYLLVELQFLYFLINQFQHPTYNSDENNSQTLLRLNSSQTTALKALIAALQGDKLDDILRALVQLLDDVYFPANTSLPHLTHFRVQSPSIWLSHQSGRTVHIVRSGISHLTAQKCNFP